MPESRLVLERKIKQVKRRKGIHRAKETEMRKTEGERERGKEGVRQKER